MTGMRRNALRNLSLTPEVNDALDRLRAGGHNVSGFVDDAVRKVLGLPTAAVRREAALAEAKGETEAAA